MLELSTIANRQWEMVKKAGKHQTSKQTGQDLYRKVLDPAHLLFYACTMHESYNHNASIG